MKRIFKSTLLPFLFLALSACGGAGGTGFTPGYTISGTLTGIAGRQVVLNDLTENLTVTPNGAGTANFTFPTWLADTTAYAVTVVSSPGQDCATTPITGGSNGNGTGTVAKANVANIVVTCTPLQYTVSVNITGLSGTVTLLNNGVDSITQSANGTYTFAPAGGTYPSGSAYAITVSSQPAGQTCTVTNSSGTIVGANITATVACTSPCSSSCTVGGTLTGLQAGESITFQNGADSITKTGTAGNGSFTFPTLLSSTNTYSVSITASPTNQPCSVTYGTGTVTNANITNVNVFCGYATRGSFVATDTMGVTRWKHTATLLADGTVLVVGGYSSATGAATKTAELYDPTTKTWATVGSLTYARYQHTATLLNDGRVLVVGGISSGTTALNTAELYDPITKTWSLAGSLGGARYDHTATLLNDGTNRVLVVGGSNGSAALSTAEFYTPSAGAAGSWAGAPPLTTGARLQHTATLLNDGRVLVVGGYDGVSGNNASLSTVDLYDPVTNTWTADTALTLGRRLHTATLLNDGTNRVLVAGGYNGGALNTAEVYTPGTSPATGTWVTTAGSLAGQRYMHTATLLLNGKVLVAGGYSGCSGCGLATAEVYDPASDSWTAAGSLVGNRYQHTAVLLTAGPNAGKVLVAGGNSGTAILGTSELFDPASSLTVWSATGNLTARSNHTATRLNNGTVLVAGGWDGSAAINGSELYDSLGASSSGTGSLTTARYDHTATLLANGKVLVVGGATGTVGNITILASAELYDPGLGTWSSGGTLNTARSQHTATLLYDGRVLVAGGSDGSALTSAEIYDPGTNTWATVGSLAAARYQHTATLLPGGKVLVAGGVSGGTTALSSAEVFDPNTPVNGVYSWTTGGSMPSAHTQHTATLLANGTVLVAGGKSGSTKLNKSAVYTPGTNTWAATGNLAGARTLHTATLLPSGQVLVTGGLNSAALATAELYDSTLGTWSSSGNLGTARYQHAATLLENGKLLVTGGYSGSTTLNSAELGW